MFIVVYVARYCIEQIDYCHISRVILRQSIQLFTYYMMICYEMMEYVVGTQVFFIYMEEQGLVYNLQTVRDFRFL